MRQGSAGAPYGSADVTARRRAAEIARAHGWNATSYQTLREGFAYFFHEDGYVAYVDTGSAWVAAGSPVCAEPSIADAARAFVEEARARRRRSCFFAVEPRFLRALQAASAAGSSFGVDAVQIGEQPAWDPRSWDASLKREPRLREQLRRARAKGVTARAVAEAERPALASEIERLTSRWLATRAMPPMGFLVATASAGGRVDEALFVASRAGRLVGVAQMIPVPGRDGFFVEHLLRDPEAPNGTVELMVDTAMRWASDRGASWLTLGLAPLAGEVGLALRIARRLTWLYDFEGLRRFKAKLRPRDWLPVYLAYPSSQGAALTTFDALAAFATGGMLRFGARLVTRGHPAVLRALAMLLLPWTVLLAASSPAHWFDGHAAVKWAWTAFDAGVCAGLFRLLRRPSSALASLLAALVALDAVLAAVEALLWNVPRLHGGLDLAVIAAGIAGPTVAALALRGATARLERASL